MAKQFSLYLVGIFISTAFHYRVLKMTSPPPGNSVVLLSAPTALCGDQQCSFSLLRFFCPVGAGVTSCCAWHIGPQQCGFGPPQCGFFPAGGYSALVLLLGQSDKQLVDVYSKESVK